MECLLGIRFNDYVLIAADAIDASRTPYHVNLLLAGYDDVDKKAELFFMDVSAACVELPYCAHGYGGYFTLSTMDAYYTPELPVTEGMELMKKCVGEIGKRLVRNLPKFKVRIVDKDGIRSMGDINTKDLKIFD